jgi:histidinol-phosphate/aromatic aminotransferase/cobyric acid decarboxylase-like protein
MIVPPPGPHGGDGPTLARALGIDPGQVLDLSASLNPVAPDVAPVAARHLDALRAYPDPGPATAAFARAMNVDRHRLVLTNGAAEAIALVAAYLGRGSVEDPEFSLYRRHLPVVDPAGPRWRSNPHNPSGRLAGSDEKAAVWDEAFWPLATGTWSRGDADRGAIVIGSLTKLFACPGLRIGYVLGPDQGTASAIEAAQPRWALNGLAAALLPELLERCDLEGWCQDIKVLRTDLCRLLEKGGWEPQPSDANWVLVHAPGLREQLANQAIAVRDCASFGLPGTVRIAVPDEAGLDRLAKAL